MVAVGLIGVGAFRGYGVEFPCGGSQRDSNRRSVVWWGGRRDAAPDRMYNRSGVVADNPSAPTLRRRAAQAHAQSGWIWPLNSIAYQITQSVPRTRRDDPIVGIDADKQDYCSPHTQG